jgi:hypothetical protein
MEVLIAISLLGLLSAGIVTTLRMGLSAMERTNRRIIANRRVTGAQNALEQQLLNFIPVMAEAQGDLQAAPERLPFFQGEPQSMRLVSSYSLQEASRGFPRIVELHVISGDEGKGVRLIVNEILYTGPRSAGIFFMGRAFDPIANMAVARFRPIEAGEGSFVLADRLEFCKFLYLDAPNGMPPAWLPLWAKPGWPRAIRVEMAPIEEDAGQLRPLAVTAPLHVDRTPVFDYGDF